MSKLSYSKKAIYGLLVAGMFLLLLECLLAAWGVQSTLVDRDPFVGFESSVPLFVPSRDDDGGTYLQTAKNKLGFFNVQRFPKHKSADTKRIFCLGGSTTFGRPYDDRTSFVGWLREFLPLADSQQQWEVINAGGISYASYRVAALMDELVQYSPDLFIVYTGHNEFLEERTYRDLNASSPILRRWAATLHQSRTYSLISRWLGPGAPGTDPSDSNLSSTLPAEVDAILDHSVGPDAYHRDDRLRSDVLAHFEFNLARMVETARSVGADVIFVTPTANMKDFSPFKSEHVSGLDEEGRRQFSSLMKSAGKLEAQGDAGQAIAVLSSVAALDRQHADLHFRLGKLLFDQEKFSQARKSFQAAINNDICPLRATSDIQHLIERTAIDQRAALVDFDSILMNDCLDAFGHGCPGREYFLDHVHPTVAGHRLLALAILQAMTGKGIVTPGSQWGDQAIALASRRVEARIDVELQSRALTNLAQVLSWAGKQEEAGPLALEAVRMRSRANLGDDAESMFYAAVTLATGGRDAEATELLEKVVQLEPANAPARWRLAALLYDQENYEEARLHFAQATRLDPQDAYSHQMLGAVLIKLERYEEALAALTRAAELDSGNATVRDQLQRVRKQLGRD